MVRNIKHRLMPVKLGEDSAGEPIYAMPHDVVRDKRYTPVKVFLKRRASKVPPAPAPVLPGGQP